VTRDTRLVERGANITATLALVIGIVIFAANNLGNRYFWSDEASSFLTSLGYPPVGQTAGTLAQSWAANQSHVEPGLFNWLERFWALGLGSDITTLRLLPFVFFLVYIACLLLFARLVGAPWFVACAAASLMLLENITPYYALEFRPTISGLAASIALPLIAIWLTLRKNVPRGVLLFIPIFIFFGSMQYNSVPIVLGVVGLLLVATLRTGALVGKWALRLTALFSLLWLPVVYVLLKGNPFDLAGGDSFGNIPEAYIPNMPLDVALRTIFTNFFSFTALPRTAFLILLPVLWILKKYPRPTRESDTREWVVNGLWVVVFLGTASSFALGVLGFIPWILGTRWSITEVGLIALSVIGLVGLAVQSKFFGRPSIRVLAAVLSVLVCLTGAFRLANYERTPGYNWTSALEAVLEAPPGSAYIDFWTLPELRYWVEYSGDYDQFREAWIKDPVQMAGINDKAGPEEITDFLNSDAKVLVLRSASLLDEISVPEGVSVQLIESWGDDPQYSADPPVLLFRD